MAKPERRTSHLPSVIAGEPPTVEQEAAAKTSTLDTISHELKRSQDMEQARKRSLATEYGKAGVKMAPFPEDVTPEQQYAAHEDTVATIRAEMAIQESATHPRQATGGIDDASIELIKAEMKKGRRRVSSVR